jgi:hypothetical protein
MPYKDKETRDAYHREYNREYMKRSRKENHAAFIQRETDWRANNPAKRLIYSTRQTAKLKGLEHTITEEDLCLPVNCPYLGFPIDYSAGTGKTMEKPSVDRIDPTKGYVKGNVEVVSSFANTMKNRATKEQLVAFATEVLRRW